MGRAKECCHPMKKRGHKCVRKNLFLVTEKWHAVFKSLIGLHLCDTCRRSIYEKKDNPKFTVCLPEQKTPNENVFEEVEPPDDPEQDENNDSTFRCDDLDAAEKIKKINNVFCQSEEPLIKKKRFSQFSRKDKQTLSEALNKMTNNKSCDVDDNDFETLYIRDIKSALVQQSNRSGKIQILTTLPSHWSIAKIKREFEVSRRMVSKAKKLRKESGHGSRPNKRASRNLPSTTASAVENFYPAD